MILKKFSSSKFKSPKFKLHSFLNSLNSLKSVNSLRFRLVASTTVLFIFFIGMTGYIIDSANVAKQRSVVLLNLQTQIHDLIKIANLQQEDALNFPADLPDRRFMHAKSGLYAAVANNNKITWLSPSTLGVEIPFFKDLEPGDKEFTTVRTAKGTSLFLLSVGYAWLDKNEQPILFTFNVAENDANYRRELTAFRHGLWTWLSILTILLLITQAKILTWSLKPLNKISTDLEEIKNGRREYLDSNYIQEVSKVTAALNTLLRFERDRQTRYKNSLGDLAHSFKTPLAIINNVVTNEDLDKKISSTLDEQVKTLNDLVTYQLRRAQAAGTRSSLHTAIKVVPIINKTLSALSKVYKTRDIIINKDMDDAAKFYGDQGDLLEVVGNLLDNAHKWCKSTIGITVSQNIKNMSSSDTDAKVLTIIIEDDGPGIDNIKKQEILKRGVRADEKTPGHGIGMSIITDIINAYCGDIIVQDSALGGAKFIVTFHN